MGYFIIYYSLLTEGLKVLGSNLGGDGKEIIPVCDYPQGKEKCELGYIKH